MPNGNENNTEEICTPTSAAALFTMAEIWEQSKCSSTGTGMKKTWYIHVIHTHPPTYKRKLYSAMKKKEILPFVTTWMDHDGIMLNGISKTEKDKYWIILDGITYMQNLKLKRKTKGQNHRNKE